MHGQLMNLLQYPVMFSAKQDINMPQEKQHPAEMILQFWPNYVTGLW